MPETSVRVAVLGPVLVAAAADGALVEPAGQRGRTLLVSLALAGADGVSTSRLVDELWGDAPPRQAKAALQTLVSRVRQSACPDLIDSTPVGYTLARSATSDLALAEELLVEAARQDPATAAETLDTAVALFRGEPGQGLDGTAVGDELAARATGLLTRLRRARASARLDSGDGAGALADAEFLRALSPLDEEATAVAIRALAGLGRRNDALRLFADLRERLLDELGSEPSAELIALNAGLLRDVPAAAGDAPAAPVVPTPRRVAVGLRTAPNELLGRAADVEEVERGLAGSRLVTILGPGGLGKTRLAQEVAARAAVDTARVVVVELAGVRAEEDVVLAVAGALGLREPSVSRLRFTDPTVRRGVRERLTAVLLELPTLLVLDNCEHVVDTVAALAADLLADAPGLRVLATSRSPLEIGAETVHPLGALATSGSAAQLFEQRARAARPGVALPRDVVERLCARLDGMPLAIELAAARVRSMAVDEIERRLGNRFALLTTGDRSAPERHRTLTAVIDWSWNLLGDDERTLLARLSRFPDGFSAEAAQIVGATGGQDVTDALDGLVRQSLVQVADEPGTGRVRYRLLETVREFGDARLIDSGQADDVREAMFRWAEELSVGIRDDLDGADQVRQFAVMGAEQDDLVHVLRLALELRRAGTAADVFAVLGYYWMMSGSQADIAALTDEVVDVLRRAPAPAPAHRDAELLCLTILGSQHLFGAGRGGTVALARLRRLVRVGGPAANPRLAALSGLFLAVLVGPEPFQAHLAGMIASDDDVLVELGTMIQAQIGENEGRVAESLALSLRAYESADAHGHAWAAATTAGFIAQLHAQEGRPVEALEWTDRARTGLLALGAIRDLAEIEWRQATAWIALGRADDARAGFTALLDSDATTSEQDDVRVFARAGLAEIAFLDGEPLEGLRQYDEAVVSVRSDRGRFRSPLISMSEAAALAAHVRSDAVACAASEHDPDHVARLATRLRTRVLGQARVPGAFQDGPITGSAVFALAAWMLRDLPDGFAATGRRLAVLASAMHGRQELPSLEHVRLAGEVDLREGGRLDPAEARAEALRLLADRRLRPEFLRP